MSDKRPLTARELLARGIEQDQFDRPFAGGESPEAKRAAAEEEANRRRNAERSKLGHRALYERGLRVLGEPAGTAPDTSSTPPSRATTERPLQPTSTEARAAQERAMDGRLAALWPGRRSE